MKILFLAPSPPNNLNRIRSKNIITSLAKLGHKIFLISLVKNKREVETLEMMKSYVTGFVGIKQPVWMSIIQCAFGLFLPIPLRVSYCFSWKLRKELKKEKYNNFDLIYVKRLRMAQYASIFSSNNKIFIDITDSMTKYYERLKNVARGLSKILAFEEYIKHKLYEPAICKKFNRIVICSEEDRDYLIHSHKCRRENFYVLENGINIKEWKHRQNIQAVNLYNLVFWGVMNVETNSLSCKYFIKKVMPLLSNKFTFTIIGPKPGCELTRYENQRIKFLGYVRNINDALSNMGIFVCPLVSGAGVKNKIIQASLIGMLGGTPNLGQCFYK